MTSNSADWVRLEVRLISSPKNRLHITLPGWYTSRPVSFWNTVKPTMSEGSTSGVNCTRLSFSSSARAKASASVVLPHRGCPRSAHGRPPAWPSRWCGWSAACQTQLWKLPPLRQRPFWLYCMVIPPGVFCQIASTPTQAAIKTNPAQRALFSSQIIRLETALPSDSVLPSCGSGGDALGFHLSDRRCTVCFHRHLPGRGIPGGLAFLQVGVLIGHGGIGVAFGYHKVALVILGVGGGRWKASADPAPAGSAPRKYPQGR